MLAVVEDKQDSLAPDATGNVVCGLRMDMAVPSRQDVGDGLRETGRVGHCRELDQPYSVGVTGRGPAGHFEAQARLAHAARPGEGDES